MEDVANPFAVAIVNRDHDDIIGTDDLVELVLNLVQVSGVQVELGGAGNLAGDDAALGTQHVGFLLDAVVNVGQRKIRVNQQNRNQGYQQYLVLDTNGFHSFTRSRALRSSAASGSVTFSVRATR